jgi:hypothetical protein
VENQSKDILLRSSVLPVVVTGTGINFIQKATKSAEPSTGVLKSSERPVNYGTPITKKKSRPVTPSTIASFEQNIQVEALLTAKF